MDNKVGEGCYLFSRINEYGNLKVIRVHAEDGKVQDYELHDDEGKYFYNKKTNYENLENN